VVPPAIAATLLFMLAADAQSQLRPLDPLMWEVYEPGTYLVGAAACGCAARARASQNANDHDNSQHDHQRLPGDCGRPQ
jgi:hypothetical protein